MTVNTARRINKEEQTAQHNAEKEKVKLAAAERVCRFMDKNCWKLLHFAAYTDWPDDTLRMLVKAASAINPTRDIFVDLSKALGWPLEVVYKTLTSTDNVNHVDKHQRTSLHIAANRDNYRFVRSLLAIRTTNINAIDDKGLTAMHYAAKQGHGRVVTCLCLHKANCNIPTPKNSGSKMPIHYAAMEGHGSIVRILVQHGQADIYALNRKGKNVLHLAASCANSGAKEAMKIIFELVGPNNKVLTVSGKDQSGNTPLHYAVEAGSLSNVKFLIEEHNAEINAQDKTNQTCAHIAAYNGDLNILKYLVAKGADLNLLDEDNVSILRYAQEAKHKKIIVYLKTQLNLEVNDSDMEGLSDEESDSDLSDDSSELSSSDEDSE